jgi:hypothetical protein
MEKEEEAACLSTCPLPSRRLATSRQLFGSHRVKNWRNGRWQRGQFVISEREKKGGKKRRKEKKEKNQRG